MKAIFYFVTTPTYDIGWIIFHDKPLMWMLKQNLLPKSICIEQNRTEGLFPYKHIIYKYMW